MNAQERRKGRDRALRRFSARGRFPGRRCLISLSAVLLACSLICELRSETPASVKRERSAPIAADFSALVAACRSLDPFVVANTILIGKADQANSGEWQLPCDLIPAQSPILAFEENSHFISAIGDASHILGTSQPADGKEGKPTLVRHFLFLKPSVFVLDDLVRQTASDRSVRWLIHCRSAGEVAGRQLRVSGGNQELVCETLWPPPEVLQKKPGWQKTSESVYHVEVQPEANTTEVRWLHVFQLRRSDDGAAPAQSVVESHDGRLELAITTADRVFRLSLPPPGVESGRVAVEAADGKTIVPRRPLPAGVLPHGPEGVRLIERWDQAYRDQRAPTEGWSVGARRRPPWDTGVPADDLKQAVEQGVIRPCRTVELGCGSGTNAIYLASKGFDVTAIDVAPTALSIAEAEAQKAGVGVRWLLADVLAPPELEPFDFIFDRGCYHNVRYVDAAAFMESVRRLSRPGTRFLVLSLNRDGPPGVREEQMRGDFSPLFEFEWLRESGIETREGEARRPAWSVMLRRKGD